MASDQTKILSAVYPNYFPMVPSNIKKGGSNVKGIFKGQYQVYPPIKTITLSNFTGIDTAIYIIFRITRESGKWYYEILNQPSRYYPSWKFTIRTSYTSYSYGGGTSTEYKTETITISAGYRSRNSKYEFTASNSYTTLYAYGAGTSYSSTSWSTTYNGTTYYFCSYCYQGERYSEGNSVYRFDITIDGQQPNFSSKQYCHEGAFTIVGELSRNSSGTSTYTKFDFPVQQDSQNYGYMLGNYLYLYTPDLPNIPPDGMYISGISPSTKLNRDNTWHYLSAYLTDKTFSTLTNYYKNLVNGRTTDINLYDYGVSSSKLTKYRYDLQSNSNGKLQLYNVKRNTSYEWDLSNCSATFTFTPWGDNVSNGFYILGFYLSYGSGLYVHFQLRQGGSVKSEKTTFLSPSTTSDGLANTATWNLNANNVALSAGTSSVTTRTILSGGNGYSDPMTWTATHAKNLGTSQISIKLQGLNNGAKLYGTGHKFLIYNGVDIVSTWGSLETETNTSKTVQEYFYSPPSSSSDSRTFRVYMIVWSGFVGTARHQMSAAYLGTFTVYAKASTTTGGITFNT